MPLRRSEIATTQNQSHGINRASGDALAEDIVSGWLAGDDGLGQVLQQVDEISHALTPETPESQKLSDALKLTVSCAVRQTLLERELRSLALTDELTSLYNRRGFWASATQQLKLAHRNTHEASLFFCDLDNLKQINDSYGHGEGDRALVCAANALAETFRDSDILARLGGDEFAVLASEASRQHQEIILDRLRKNLEKSHATETRYTLSLSFGVAHFDPRSPVSLGELMAQADQAMYKQKRRRR